MNILIIEDEIFAARRLVNMLAELDPGLNVVAQLESVRDSIKWFQSNPEPDLILLDIHLEDDLSFTIFKAVNISAPVVFTTATDEMAARALDILGIDYLLKPIVQEELAAIISKYANAPRSGRIALDPSVFDGIVNRTSQ